MTFPSETTSLLSSEQQYIPDVQSIESEQRSNHTREHAQAPNRLPFYLTILLTFIVQTGIATQGTPATNLIEDIICRKYYHEHGILNPLTILEYDCKATPIQAHLTEVRAIGRLFGLLPGIFMVVPIGMLADKYGVEPFLALSILGTFLSDAWLFLVCWFGDTWSVEWTWAAACFKLIGGGPAVTFSLTYIYVSTITPPSLRASRFFLLDAASYLGSVSCSLLSALLIDHHPWAPAWIGLSLIIIAACINVQLFVLRKSVKIETSESDSLAEDDINRSQSVDDLNPEPQVKALHIISALQTAWKYKQVVFLLIGALPFCTATNFNDFQPFYLTKKFHWTWAQASYLLSFDEALKLLALLFVLPTLSNIWAANIFKDAQTKDSWFLKFSILLTFLGYVGFATSPNPGLWVLSAIVCSLGIGFSACLRSLVSGKVTPEHRGLVLSAFMLIDTLATFIAQPIWPGLYKIALRWDGFWLGFPFMIAALMQFTTGAVTVITLVAGRRET